MNEGHICIFQTWNNNCIQSIIKISSFLCVGTGHTANYHHDKKNKIYTLFIHHNIIIISQRNKFYFLGKRSKNL